MSGINGHLADSWGELIAKENNIKREKERLKTLILLTNSTTIYGNSFKLTVSSVTSDRFDSTAFQKADPTTARQYRKVGTTTRIDCDTI